MMTCCLKCLLIGSSVPHTFAIFARLLLELGRFPAIFRGGDLVKTPQRLELTFSNTGRGGWVCSSVKCQSSGGTNPRTLAPAEKQHKGIINRNQR